MHFVPIGFEKQVAVRPLPAGVDPIMIETSNLMCNRDYIKFFRCFCCRCGRILWGLFRVGRIGQCLREHRYSIVLKNGNLTRVSNPLTDSGFSSKLSNPMTTSILPIAANVARRSAAEPQQEISIEVRRCTKTVCCVFEKRRKLPASCQAKGPCSPEQNPL